MARPGKRQTRAAIADFLALANCVRVFFCVHCNAVFKDENVDVLSRLVPVCPECKDKLESGHD